MTSTLFLSFEVGSRDVGRELVDLILVRPIPEQRVAFRVISALWQELDRRAAQEAELE